MDTFAEIADERRRLADVLSELTVEQQSAQSLCDKWTVHDVAGHLIVPLEVGTLTFLVAMLRCRGNFDAANVLLTRQQARRPFHDVVEVLRRQAEKRFTPPGAGPEAPLTDVLVHGLDICWPLGLSHTIAEVRLRKSLTYVTSPPGARTFAQHRLNGLRFAATDLHWSHGSGPTVSGRADALLLAITGRTAALSALGGDGLPTLRTRMD